jgi:flagellar biosynthesis protein FliP
MSALCSVLLVATVAALKSLGRFLPTLPFFQLERKQPLSPRAKLKCRSVVAACHSFGQPTTLFHRSLRENQADAKRSVQSWPRFVLTALVFLALGSAEAVAQTNSTTNLLSTSANLIPFKLNLGVEAAQQPQDVDVGVKILFAITLLSLAPSIILLMTSFTRIVIVLSFVRSALALQGTPANQILIGLSLFITYFIMAPVWERIDSQALQPYIARQISSDQALSEAAKPIRVFMLKQTRPKDVELFVELARLGPVTSEQLPLKVVIPAFIVSELRTAFQMGFLLFVPFILIDLVVATVLMSMGMMMMPPTTVALPLKLLLFVLVDGWGLVVRSVVQSFAT